MAAKKKDPLMDDDYAVDYDPASSAAISKLPINVTGGAKLLSEYMEIPVDRVLEYSKKGDTDFAPWPEDKFEELVESVRQVGILEAVTVRISPINRDYYEMLAGEHRWKAAKAAGLKTIPARVMRKCEDDMADSIFYLTNVMRRELTLKDKINAWHYYLLMTKYKHQGEKENAIKNLIEEGILSEELSESNITKRQIYRYAHLFYLCNDMIKLIEENKLSLVNAEELATIPKERQLDLLPYAAELNKPEICKALRELNAGKMEGIEWNKENISKIFAPKKAQQPITASICLNNASKRAKIILKKQLSHEFALNAEEVIDEALQLYFEKHPEARAKPKKGRSGKNKENKEE